MVSLTSAVTQASQQNCKT